MPYIERINIYQFLNFFLNLVFMLFSFNFQTFLLQFVYSLLLSSTFYCLCQLPPADVATPWGLLTRILKTFCCFHQPIQNKSQFNFHPYGTLFFSLSLFFKPLPFVCHTSLVFIAKLQKSSSHNIFFANSISIMHTLKTINRSTRMFGEVPQTNNHFTRFWKLHSLGISLQN